MFACLCDNTNFSRGCAILICQRKTRVSWLSALVTASVERLDDYLGECLGERLVSGLVCPLVALLSEAKRCV